MKQPIQLMSIDKFRVVKIVRIVGPDWNRFSGYIIYKRILTQEYRHDTPDFIDDIILNSIKELYPAASIVLNKDLFFEGEYEDILTSYKGGVWETFEIRFFPSIPYDMVSFLAGKTWNDYVLKLKLSLMLGPSNEKIDLISKYNIANLDYDKYDDLEKAYKTFD